MNGAGTGHQVRFESQKSASISAGHESGEFLIDFFFSDDRICLHSPDPYHNREEIKPLSLNY